MDIKKNIYHFLYWYGRYHLICSNDILFIDNELRKKINLNLYMIRTDATKQPKSIEEFVHIGVWGHILTYDTMAKSDLWALNDNTVSNMTTALNNTDTIVLSSTNLEEIKTRLEKFHN